MNNVIWTDSKYVKVKEKSNGAIEEGEEDRQSGEKDGFWEYQKYKKYQKYQEYQKYWKT